MQRFRFSGGVWVSVGHHAQVESTIYSCGVQAFIGVAFMCVVTGKPILRCWFAYGLGSCHWGGLVEPCTFNPREYHSFHTEKMFGLRIVEVLPLNISHLI